MRKPRIAIPQNLFLLLFIVGTLGGCELSKIEGSSGEVTPDAVVFCAENEQCPAGTYCSDGLCTSSASCNPVCLGAACPRCIRGYMCDDRGTCVPSTLTCREAVTCDREPPICRPDSAPAIDEGCYTGQCFFRWNCPDGPPIACSDREEDACLASPNCEPTYQGADFDRCEEVED